MPSLPPLARRAVLLALPLSACGGWERVDREERRIEPPHYEYLTRLRLNVAVVDIEDRSVQGGPNNVSARAPYPPAMALRKMAEDRLLAVGGSGQARFIIKRADLTASRGGYDGAMDVELDIINAEGDRVAFAEALVNRRQSDDRGERATLADMVGRMMEAMNIEFEFQCRRNLRTALLENDTAPSSRDAIPAPVEQENLAPLRGRGT